MSGRSKARKPNRITALRKTVASLSCNSRSVSGVILIFSNGLVTDLVLPSANPSWSDRTSRCRGSASYSILSGPIVTVGNPSQNSVKNCHHFLVPMSWSKCSTIFDNECLANLLTDPFHFGTGTHNAKSHHHDAGSAIHVQPLRTRKGGALHVLHQLAH